MLIIIKFINAFKHLRLRLIFCVVLTLLAAVVSLAGPEVLRLVANSINYSDRPMFYFAFVMAVITAILSSVLSAAYKIFFRDTVNKYEEAIQLSLFEKLTDVNKIKLQQLNSGEITTQLISNAMAGSKASISSIVQFSEAFFDVVFSSVYMLILQWQIMVAVIVFNVFMRFILYLAEVRLRSSAKKAIAITKTNNTFMFDIFRNMLSVRIFKKESYFENKFVEKETETLFAELERKAWGLVINDGTWALMKLLEFAVVFAFGGYLIYSGVTSLPTLLAFTAAVVIFGRGLTGFSFSIVNKNNALACIESMNELLSTEEIEPAHLGLEHAFNTNAPVVSFDSVDFKHGDRHILKNVSFEIFSNEKVLIKGPNGQGKTTLLNLIAGLYRPCSGVISLGGKDISKKHLGDIARWCSYIQQGSYILPGDVCQNITLSSNDSTEQDGLREKVLDAINLKNQKEIPPKNLSTGEKQRLNIGRSLYHGKMNNSTIILCDEIFSNLDSMSSGRIIDTLLEEYVDCTIIMIAHHSIDFKFDRVFHVENKSVKEVEHE